MIITLINRECVDFHSRMLAFHGAKLEPPLQACGVSAFPHLP